MVKSLLITINYQNPRQLGSIRPNALLQRIKRRRDDSFRHKKNRNVIYLRVLRYLPLSVTLWRRINLHQNEAVYDLELYGKHYMLPPINYHYSGIFANSYVIQLTSCARITF